jgi:hypothetical protein
MPDATSDVIAHRRGPVLGSALLARLHELNRDFLELLVAEHRSGAPPPLPRKTLDTLAELSASQRAALAATPFTLYSLGFEDQEFWRNALNGGVEPPWEERYPERVVTSRNSFCKVALLHAWHIASVGGVATRMVLSMPIATVARFAIAPLWRLDRIATEHPTLLAPRWPTNPGFWPDLIRFALADDRRLATVQLLGSQLIAAELEAAGGREVPGFSLPRSPRLRAKRSR